MHSSSSPSPQVKTTAQIDPEPVSMYQPPGYWRTNNRTRQFTPLTEREHSRETDRAILARSVDAILHRQDERGSFYTDEEYRSGDKVDDQLAGAAFVAFQMAQAGQKKELVDALERAVRFHLDHLVHKSPASPYRFSRYFIDRDTGEWCNTLWCLWGAAQVIQFGSAFLSKEAAGELLDLMGDYWLFVSTYAARDENPCHNQLIAYCHIGNLYAQVSGNKSIAREVSVYYHERLRRLRIYDRGHWIYTEFNQWDPHYGLVSWMGLEALAMETGDPAYREDAEETARYYNERVSAGGYVWGGSRHNEGGLDEFVHLAFSRGADLGLDRLLMPEPSHLWRRLIMPPHEGRTLITRMDLAPERRPNMVPPAPTPWHFLRDQASVCLQDDFKLVHLSSSGLEIIPAANAAKVGSGLVWLQGGKWQHDVLQARPPLRSAGHSYHRSASFETKGAAGLCTSQRGYIWETRQWWIGSGPSLLWIGQLVTHAAPRCDKLEFILGTPILTKKSGRAVPVTEVESAAGAKADSQGPTVTISSSNFLKMGDLFVGATVPIEFLRPSEDSFHTFPLRQGLWRDCESSNELRLQLSAQPVGFECRESLFFAVEIGSQAPNLRPRQEAFKWGLEAGSRKFEARQLDGIWHYSFETEQGRTDLPQIGFGFSELGLRK